MPRKRDLRPGFFRNATLSSLPALTRLLFQGLWIEADREGRLKDRPLSLKQNILPMDNCDVNEMLNQLAGTIDEDGSPYILRYEAENQKYIQIKNFSKHQNIHPDECQSIIPAPSPGLPLDPTASSGFQVVNNAITSLPSFPSCDLGSTSGGTPCVPLAEKAKKPRETKKASQISTDWQPCDVLAEWARSEYPPVELGRETSQFVDHHTSKGTLSKDWDASFRTWIRNTKKWSGDKQPTRKDPNQARLDDIGVFTKTRDII